MTGDQIRLMVWRQIRLQHPEYNDNQMRRAVDETYDLIIQVEEARANEN
jgi:hypothetical protein